jgi:hypothetical protein
MRLNAAIAAMSEKKKSIMGLKGSNLGRSRRREDGDTQSSKSNGLEQTVYFSANGNDEVLPEEPREQLQLFKQADALEFVR